MINSINLPQFVPFTFYEIEHVAEAEFIQLAEFDGKRTKDRRQDKATKRASEIGAGQSGCLKEVCSIWRCRIVVIYEVTAQAASNKHPLTGVVERAQLVKKETKPSKPLNRMCVELSRFVGSGTT